MWMPSVQGVIDRRILVNYRVDPAVMARWLPSLFRPHTWRGYAIGGICLIRLKDIRPGWLPGTCGIGSENAAHRIAVEWDDQTGQSRRGVYIPRRDTTSRLNALAGGRLFPGVHHHARFEVREDGLHFSLNMQSDDGEAQIQVVGERTEHLNEHCIFGTLAEASTFFEAGSVGYSDAITPGRLDGLELRCKRWNVSPLNVQHVASSYFDDTRRFPPGSACFDSALLMEGIEHSWRSLDALCCEPMLSSTS